MPRNPFKCPVCRHLFDLDTKLPRTMMGCGHTVCSSCITELLPSQKRNTFKCPVDSVPCVISRKLITSFPKNQLLIQVIDELSKANFCNEHKKYCEWKCSTDDLILCTECLFIEKHKNCEIIEHGSFIAWKDVLVDLMQGNKKGKININAANKVVKRKGPSKKENSDENKSEFPLKVLNLFLTILLLFNPFFWWFSYEKKLLKISRQIVM